MLPKTLSRLLKSLGEALFPARCLGCGDLFHGQPPPDRNGGDDPEGTFVSALAPYFCPSCRQRWTPAASPLCSRCGVMFRSRQGEDHLCGRCLEQPGVFSRARSLGIYDKTLQSAIQALKFDARVQLADPLGRLLFAAFQRNWAAGDIDVVAPVPLHRRRLRRRGFNQAYLLIRRWQPPGDTIIIRDLLIRIRDTKSQSGLDRRQRRINIKNAFAVTRPGESAGRRVLLVDDVLTTGATVDACAAALAQDGAERVDVLTLARAL